MIVSLFKCVLFWVMIGQNYTQIAVKSKISMTVLDGGRQHYAVARIANMLHLMRPNFDFMPHVLGL